MKVLRRKFNKLSWNRLITGVFSNAAFDDICAKASYISAEAEISYTNRIS
jgi:hypothetical protein